MRLHIHAIGQSIEPWITQGIQAYSKRFQTPYALQLHCHPTPKRNRNCNLEKLMQQEQRLLTSRINSQDCVVVCDEKGQAIDSSGLALKLVQWMDNHHLIHFIIGGPDGTHANLKKQANFQLALSKLTLTHAMARLLLVEALYRSISIINKHPYHR